jgi:hypothetical protein
MHTRALLLMFALATPAIAHIDLPVTLSDELETDPVSLPGGEDPAGTATLTLDNDNSIEYTITITGPLTGPPVAAHIHKGAVGVAGGVEIVLNHTTLTGTTPPLNNAQLIALFAGELYVNVHTAENPAGEIRGQIIAPAPECDCDTLSTKDFKKCVRDRLKGLDKDEKKSAEAKALKKAVKKASCGKTKGPKRAIGCCVPLTPFEGIVTDGLCHAITAKKCDKVEGARQAASCFPTNPCSPSGAFLDAVEIF